MAKIDFAKPFDLEEAQEPETPETLPATPSPLDLEAVKQALAPYHKQVGIMVEEATAIKITDPDSNKRAVELGNQARKIKKAVEAIKSSPAYMEADEFLKAVRNLIKSFTDPLDTQVERPLKAKIAAYQNEVRLEQQRREAAAREEARKQQKRIDAEQAAIKAEAERKAREAAEALKKETDEAACAALQKTIEEETRAAEAPAPQVVAPVIPEAEKVTRTEAGSAFQRKRWVCRIVAPTEVPRQYCAPVQSLLNEAVKSGIREIPGCIIEEISETSFRG